MVFRLVSLITIAASIFLVFSKLKAVKISPNVIWLILIQDFQSNLFNDWRNKSISIYQRTKITVAHLCGFLFLFLFLTGFLPVVFGYQMSGLFLIIHVKVALLMSIVIVLFVFLYSNGNQLSVHEVQKLFYDIKTNASVDAQIVLKVFYWLIVALILPAMLSIILMLYPLFGTEGLDFLADVHRWSVLLITICVIFVQYFRIILINTDKTKGV